MSLNRKQQVDYTLKYQIRSGRVTFADFVQRRQLISEGRLLGLNLYPPDHDQSIIPIIREGETNTTPEELERYLSEVIVTNKNTISTPGPPTITSTTGANTSIIVNFTSPSFTGGLQIIDYEYAYSLDNGLSWSSWISGATTTSPIIVTGLINQTAYVIKIRAMNDLGAGIESIPSSLTTPDATIQTFTAVGSSSWTAPTDIYYVEYLVVGGGGGGGNGYDSGGGGGGGGGMVITGTLSILPNTSYNIIVGDGGNGGANERTNRDGQSGISSVFDTIIALGGGFGKGSRTQTGGSGLRGTGAINPNTASVGGNGGGSVGTAVGGCGGGGGGAGGDGTSGSGSANNPISGGSGDNGITSDISGLSQIYGRGGNGAKGNTNVVGSNGTLNTGNGGSAGSSGSNSSNGGGKGGSGIVILKY
jgi:hypothetical protein